MAWSVMPSPVQVTVVERPRRVPAPSAERGGSSAASKRTGAPAAGARPRTMGSAGAATIASTPTVACAPTRPRGSVTCTDAIACAGRSRSTIRSSASRAPGAARSPAYARTQKRCARSAYRGAPWSAASMRCEASSVAVVARTAPSGSAGARLVPPPPPPPPPPPQPRAPPRAGGGGLRPAERPHRGARGGLDDLDVDAEQQGDQAPKPIGRPAQALELEHGGDGVTAQRRGHARLELERQPAGEPVEPAVVGRGRSVEDPREVLDQPLLLVERGLERGQHPVEQVAPLRRLARVERGQLAQPALAVVLDAQPADRRRAARAGLEATADPQVAGRLAADEAVQGIGRRRAPGPRVAVPGRARRGRGARRVRRPREQTNVRALGHGGVARLQPPPRDRTVAAGDRPDAEGPGARSLRAEPDDARAGVDDEAAVAVERKPGAGAVPPRRAAVGAIGGERQDPPARRVRDEDATGARSDPPEGAGRR